MRSFAILACYKLAEGVCVESFCLHGNFKAGAGRCDREGHAGETESTEIRSLRKHSCNVTA